MRGLEFQGDELDRFAVRCAAIGEAWESVRDATGQIRTKLADLDTSLGPLRATWTGEAAESFEVARATWVREAEERGRRLDRGTAPRSAVVLRPPTAPVTSRRRSSTTSPPPSASALR
ncbi:WXG100 family type VII secretion target [Saccharopolyspora hirsuta]|uniref:WXG100 family type VII secretion target n=1 Tax=Saccharopolyspora hirsuta TaxID=1837 RepID=UPI003691BB67